MPEVRGDKATGEEELMRKGKGEELDAVDWQAVRVVGNAESDNVVSEVGDVSEPMSLDAAPLVVQT